MNPLHDLTPTGPASLNRARRDQSLRQLADQGYDVIVVGGGVTGAGVALDAASRGLRTALVERVDLAAGTSRWSSKLVHGGLRYLAKADIGVAWESTVERRALMRDIAPHLTRPASYLVPLDTTTGRAMGILAELGIRLADGMRIVSGASRRDLPPPRRISALAACHEVPGLRHDTLRGAVVYWDGQLEDDARLVTAIARTAAAHGADIITRCAASELGERALTVTDTLTDQSFTARGVVINATGVWAAEHDDSLSITPSRGSHLVVRAERLGHPRSVFTAPVPHHLGRYVFGIPLPDGLVLIGLTDEPAPGVDGVEPPVPPEDVDFLIATINQVLDQPLEESDIVGAFAGLRPLVSSTASSTADVSRKHLLVDEPGRAITIAGGKLTTYRQMAEDAVDAACRRLGTERVCRTRTLPLVGAAPRDILDRVAAPTRLVRRYGTEAPLVQRLTTALGDLGGPVAPGCPTVGGELLFGVLHEGALTVEDLVERRTRVSLVHADLPDARQVAQQVIDLATAESTAHR